MGYGILLLLGLLVVLPLAGLLQLASLPGFEPENLAFWQSDYIVRALQFSLWQAALSALLSIIPALWVARALFYFRNGLAKRLILRLFGLPLVVPSIVAVLGIVSVYGSNGWLPLGRNLYGLNGILLVHVFFNLPLAIRLLLPAWQSIPANQFRLAEQLGFSHWLRWRYIEWPVVRESLPGVAVLIFMLCLTSFAVVLSLGGGPKATTLEVAIYQSLRFDFDPAQAVILAMLQLVLCLLVALVVMRLQTQPEVSIESLPADQPIHNYHSWLERSGIVLTVLFVATPMLSLLLDVFVGPVAAVLSNPKTWLALSKTVIIGLLAAFCTVLLSWFILQASSDQFIANRPRRAKWIELAASSVYVIPPLVIGTGYFVLLSPHVFVFDWVYPIVLLVNVLMGMPFVIRTLGPVMRRQRSRYHYLCANLGVTGWSRFRYVDWPLLRQPAALAAALVAAIAMGDLGVIALFGTTETATLPLLVYQQMGAYQIKLAMVTAMLLLACCFLVYWMLERIIGGKPRHA